MTERDLLIDCLRRLNTCGVPYMLTGSMASNVWGVPRTTHDLDFVIQLEPAAVPLIVKAFEGDFFIQAASVQAALHPPYQFNAIDNRSALKVDFWVLKQDLFDQLMFSRRRSMTLFGVAASIATAEDVLLHKLRWHRMTPSDRQLSDAAGVWVLQQDSLDIQYLKGEAENLGVRDELDQIMSGMIRPKAT